MKAKHPASHAALLFAIVVAVMCYGSIWSCFKPQVFSGVKADFPCFYRAGRMVVTGDGARVYDLNAERQYDARLNTSFVDAGGHSFSLPFVFAPFVLLVFAPLSRLPYSEAELIWYCANVCMLLALPFVLRRRLGWDNRGVVFALLAPLLFVPVTLALMQGQPSLLLLLIFAVAFADLSGGNDAQAGSMLALATFKPQLIIPMLLALVVVRKWKVLAAFAATCLVLFGVSVRLVGWHSTLAYPRAVLEFSRLSGSLGGEHPENMPNLRGFVSLVLHSRMSNLAGERIALAFSAALLAGMMLRLRRSRRLSETSYSMVLVVTLLVSYHAYLHDFSLLVLPCILTADYLAGSKWTMMHTGLAVIIAAFYVIPAAPNSMHTTAVQMFAAVLLFAVMLSVVGERTRAETIRT